jgi:hypothetical protein
VAIGVEEVIASFLETIGPAVGLLIGVPVVGGVH